MMIKKTFFFPTGWSNYRSNCIELCHPVGRRFFFLFCFRV